MKTTAVVLLRNDLTIADPLQASDLAPLAQETTLQSVYDKLTSILISVQEGTRKITAVQRLTVDLTSGHGTAEGLQGLIPTDLVIINKITVVDAPVGAAVSLFIGGSGDQWAVPVKTGDVFDGLEMYTSLQVPFSNTAAPGASLVLLVQGW